MSLILCLVRQVRIELSKEALIIRQLSPREYWEKLVSISDRHVSPDMSERDWARLFGWNGSVLQLMVGDGERGPDDLDYDKKSKVLLIQAGWPLIRNANMVTHWQGYLLRFSQSHTHNALHIETTCASLTMVAVTLHSCQNRRFMSR